MLSSRFAGIPVSSSTIRRARTASVADFAGSRRSEPSTAQVAGFISEWWPASFRYGGRHQIGIGGRIASEFAPKTFVDAVLWPEFQELNAALVAYLSEVTERVIREEVHRETGEAEEVDEPPQIGR